MQMLDGSTPKEHVDGASRLTAFMARHGLQTSNDLAQAFRVTQPTSARWLKGAQGKPLEEVLQGPTLVLFELMEGGLETRDLSIAKRLAAVHARPGDFEVIEGEERWTIDVPTRSKVGGKIIVPSGHFIMVHSRWFKERIAKLRTLKSVRDDLHEKRMRMLVTRYQDAHDRMVALPR